MEVEVLAEERWNFTVFKHGDGWLLTYIAGSVGLYDVTIKLTEIEIGQIRANVAAASSLAGEFRNRRNDFRDREILPPIWPSKN